MNDMIYMEHISLDTNVLYKLRYKEKVFFNNIINLARRRRKTKFIAGAHGGKGFKAKFRFNFCCFAAMEVTEEEGKEDRISLLGDCLLTEILSRLPSTKDAIRTSSLSKRWKHIWTYVHTLILQISDFKLQPRRTEIFFSSIDKTLAQHRQLNLKKFRLHAPYGGQFDSQISNWIRYALSCNVEELDLNLLNLDFKSKFVLDESIFINSCLTDVKLVNCILNPTGAISWNNLNRLYISCGNLDEDLIENILSGYNLLDIASKSDKVKVGKSCSKMLCYLEAQGLVYPSNMEFSDIIPSDLQLLLISGDLFS